LRFRHPLTGFAADDSLPWRIRLRWLSNKMLRQPLRGPASTFPATGSEPFNDKNRFLDPLPLGIEFCKHFRNIHGLYYPRSRLPAEENSILKDSTSSIVMQPSGTMPHPVNWRS